MIQVFKNLNDFKNWRKEQNLNVGVVPTMGNLHQGHLNLLERSLQDNPVSVVTIFVNPKQFGPNEDFEKYPRTLEEDVEKIQAISSQYSDKKVVVFAPKDPSEIYPDNFMTSISVGEQLTNKLCGLSRPGHFSGVTTVVYRLFAVTKPNRAYFGQKDYQQFLVIKRMVKDLDIPVELTPIEIAREEDGLALSSRNQYLSVDERKQALVLSKTLKSIRDAIQENTSYDNIIQEALTDSRWEYLEVLNSEDLSNPDEKTKSFVIAGAYKLGATRLIDNFLAQRF